MYWICLTCVIYCYIFSVTLGKHRNIGYNDLPCAGLDFGHGSIVCVCNKAYCDVLPSLDVPPPREALVVVSSKAGMRWNVTHQSFLESNYGIVPDVDVEIIVDRSKKYQSIIGFGGAFTDAAGLNIKSLPDSLQDLVLRSYYSVDGLEYTLGRVPVGGTDFSWRPYTYNDVDDGLTDVNLEHFSLANEDYKYKIPLIKRAQELSARTLKLFASAWAAPAWMKSNNNIIGKGQLLPQYYAVWAEYYIKFFSAYQENNVTFWGMTTQNEPSDGLIDLFPFNTVGWTAVQQAKWLGNNLGPALKNSSFRNMKVMILDDNRVFLPLWVEEVMSNPRAAQYVSGVAIHWYFDWPIPPTVLTHTLDRFPNLFLLYTEACSGQWPWQPLKVVLGSWKEAQNYAEDILQNLQYGVSGWTDWNLALDTKGGPNWIKNFVDAPIIVNSVKREFYKQPMYYALAHFSKLLPEGSIRIDSSVNIVNTTANLVHPIQVVAFVTPYNATSVVLINKNNYEVKVEVISENKKLLYLTLEACSFTSLLWSILD